MIKQFKREELGNINHGWLDTINHFSFAGYYDPNRMGFGPLRVINDDIILADKGFDTHPHNDMEIISYIIHGELTHKDSMGNTSTLTRGQIQYMSAGTGITHSEYNKNKIDEIRILQIWIIPDEKNLIPNYGDEKLDWNLRVNKWLHVVSDKDGEGIVKIYRDCNFYVTEINKTIEFRVKKDRQAYLVNIEGDTLINGFKASPGDGFEIIEEDLIIIPEEKSHLIIIEMKKK